MSMHDSAQFRALTPAQRQFLDLVQENYPDVRYDCFVVETGHGGASIYLTPHAESDSSLPTCSTVSGWEELKALDLMRQRGRPPLWLWMDPDDAPSIAYSGWHTHGNCYIGCESDLTNQAEAIFMFFDDIVADRRVVISSSPDDEDLQYVWFLDTTDEEEIEELLTDPGCPAPLYVRSWTGKINGPLIDLLDNGSK